jgi:hypothetical protein
VFTAWYKEINIRGNCADIPEIYAVLYRRRREHGKSISVAIDFDRADND